MAISAPINAAPADQGIAGTDAPEPRIKEDNWILAGLSISALLFPFVASVLNVAIYINVFVPRTNPGTWVVIVGALAAGSICLIPLIASYWLTTVNLLNTRIYGELCDRSAELQARLKIAKEILDREKPIPSPSRQLAYAAAVEHAKVVQNELSPRPDGKPSRGLRWLLATGYNRLWQRIHLAEEALILIEPRNVIAATALYDEGRMRSAQISNREELLGQLRRVRKVLDQCPYLHNSNDEDAVRECPFQHHTAVRLNGSGTRQAWYFDGQSPLYAPSPSGGDASPDETPELEARQTYRVVKHCLNEFRLERWIGLVKVRNRITKTGAFTSLFGYMALSFAMMMGISATQIEAVVWFFLIGAFVGLFNRLLAESSSDAMGKNEIEDYGLAGVRVMYIPLFSGIAGIGGAVIIKVIHAGLSIAVGQTPDADGGAALPALASIFQLDVAGLFVAAVFGLAPNALLDRLKRETDRYVAELQQTASTGVTSS